MDIDRFNASLAASQPPTDLPVLLEALWYDGHGDWGRAHKIVQGQKGKDAAAVHAYLHRKEGDLSNADYWYQRADRVRETIALTEEWGELVRTLIARNTLG